MGRKRALAGKEQEVVDLWKAGKNISQISRELGVSGPTVSLELERLGIRKRKTNGQIEEHFQRIKGTDEFFYILGVIWAIGSVCGDQFRIRHKQKEVIEEICRVLKYVFGPYQMVEQNQWACYFRLNHPMYHYLEQLGWKGRWDQSRTYPNGDINDDEFIRGYISQHVSIDIARNKTRFFQRIRIYGAENILERINAFFAEKLRTTPKKLQKEGRSEVMRILYYTSKEEVPVIRRFLGI